MNGKVKNNQTSFTAAEWLEKEYLVQSYPLGLPIGIHETDAFFKTLETISGKETPTRHTRERGRLIDAYIDSHKYLFGKRAVVYGEEDMVIGIVRFLQEIGIETVLVASGGESGTLKQEIQKISKAQIYIVLGFIVYILLAVFLFNGTFSKRPYDLFGIYSSTQSK